MADMLIKVCDISVCGCLAYTYISYKSLGNIKKNYSNINGDDCRVFNT